MVVNLMNFLNYEGFAISWFENGKWRRYPLKQNESNNLNCNTMDGSNVEVLIHKENNSISKDLKSNSLYKLKVRVTPNSKGNISGIQLLLPVDPLYKCTWKPHLAPIEGMIIGDKVFRSPCIIMENGKRKFSLIPDLSDIRDNRQIPHVMDYTRINNHLTYGLCNYEATGHVYYMLDPEKISINEPVTLQFYILQWEEESDQTIRDFRPIEEFLWNKFVDSEITSDVSSFKVIKGLEKYVRYTYNWAFNNWESVCWQEFDLDGERVGAHVFIVTARQKPGDGFEEEWREKKSIWNQAWFSSIRSSYGYALWGKYWGNEDLIDKAEKNLRFTLSAPQVNGLFPGYFEVGADNKWETGEWHMSSNRRPNEQLKDYVHLLDASWTCYWLLKWYQAIKKDEKILDYVKGYVDRLLQLQLKEGNFPAWVRPDDLDCSSYLTESPEISMHIMLLCLLQEIEPEPVYIEAAEKAARFVIEKIMPTGRWEDFETYWSCSREWEGKQYGKVDARSGLYNQCNFGIYWTAEALKDLYKATSKQIYLHQGERALAEMSLHQQIWQPPFFDNPTIGGFGVMTSDDEWNDARQSLFALTYMDYYSLTKKERYRERGLLAMKASFYMMYCEENNIVKEFYENTHPNFNEFDYGFHMENFNHGDSGIEKKVGEFTIFDWGNGASATSLAELIFTQKYCEQY